MTAGKLTNAALPPGAAAGVQFPSPLHVPSESTQLVPGGGVTWAQFGSTRSSSTCTLGTLPPWRSTNAEMAAVVPSRSVPATGAARIGDCGVATVGAESAPKALGLIHTFDTSSVPSP